MLTADVLVLEARQTDQPPMLDGDLDDAAWQRAKPIHVAVHQPPTTHRRHDTVVELRAVRTLRDIYFAARWSDPTNSIDKGRWRFDGREWSRDPDTDEDRFALLFPIADSVPWFGSAGCTLTCHVRDRSALGVGTEPHWYKGTLAASERLDAWHWKSVRSNPMGYIDDKYWVYHPPHQDRKNAGRYADPRGDGPNPAAGNAASGGERPALMQDPARPASIARMLLRSEAVPFDASRFKPGDDVPGIVLSPPSGGQADIRCVGVWRDDAWHLEFRRDLNTGNDDDVTFAPGQRVPFALAVFDNVSERRKQDHGKATDLLWLHLATE